MKVINIYLLHPGSLIDFTTEEPFYWNQRKPENKVEKIKCPICGRFCRPASSYLSYDHVIRFDGLKSNTVIDECRYFNEIQINKEVELMRVASTLGFSWISAKEKVNPSKEALFIVEMRKYFEK